MFRKFIEYNFRDGHNFEVEIARMLRQLGFTANRTGNDDKGVDIIATSPTEGTPKFYIQCKYHNKTLGLEAIQQVYTGCALRGNDARPVVITSSNITLEARKIAAQLGVEIIAYPEWTDLIQGYEKHQVTRENRYGLMGILAGLSIKNTEHAIKSSQQTLINRLSEYSEPIFPPVKDLEKESRKKMISNLYEEAKLHEEEIYNLELKKSQHQQMVLDLQKEAMLLTLDYG